MIQTVLIVDDDLHVRDWLTTFLRAEGYAAIPFLAAQDALTYMRGGGPADLVLLDIRMPGINGWQFLEQRLSDPALRAVPVVIMTGHLADADWVVTFGAEAVLCKPFSCELLLATIGRCCGK